MDIFDESLELHKKLKGKTEVTLTHPINDMKDLSLVYTPGVGRVSSEIAKDKNLVWEYTGRGNAVAVVSDGSAVLGLGDIGPEAAIPVMEGKCALFKKFAGINATPIVLNAHTTDEVVAAITAIAPSFGAINLEDISAPRCFEVEERLKKTLSIPVMHDDQHGTAVVVLAGLINAVKVTGRSLQASRVVVNGVGAAGVAVMRLLHDYGVKAILAVDSTGIVTPARTDLNPEKKRLLDEEVVLGDVAGGLDQALATAGIFIGVSKANLLTAEHIALMNIRPIIFALANPVPEIMPDVAKNAGAGVVATGRSDFPNQINNVLAYPGIFRGVLDMRAPQITEGMKRAAAEALASLVAEPTAEMIIPDVFDPRVVPAVADAVKKSR